MFELTPYTRKNHFLGFYAPIKAMKEDDLNFSK